MGNPAYPSDFLGKFELFNYLEDSSGAREEQWLTPTSLIRCLWSPTNDRECPSTILYEHFDLPWNK
jgi:hypothetical protein